MSYESYRQIFLAENDICLRKNKSHTLSFELEDEKAADRIFFTGETGIYYQWKSEPDYQYLYRRIDDSLTTEEANRDQFALNMSADHCNYPKIAYKKILWPPRFYWQTSNVWKFGISVKAENLTVEETGYLHFLLEVRYKKEGVAKNIVYTDPDFSCIIDIPRGSYDWQTLSEVINFPSDKTASICFYLEGEQYDGKVYFEAPFLNNEQGNNLCSDFGPFTEDKMRFNWLGVNLSKKETPSLCIALNGKVIHDGEIFERCHRYSEWEVKIPKGVAKRGENILTFTHTSDYRDAPPYNLHEVGLISVRRDMLVACPEVVSVGRIFPVLMKTEWDDVRFILADVPTGFSAASPLVCGKAGLNVLYLVCDRPQNDISFTLQHDCGEIKCNIDRCVEKHEDGVTVGTGDMVYINQNKDSFEDYLCWYFSNHVGNLLTVRPTYRWSGSRVADGKLWRETADLFDQMGISYVHMRDGRELQGCDANPLPEELTSPHFLGRQNHEFDGQLVYWGHRDITGNLNEEMFYDLFMRRFLTQGERMNTRYCPASYFSKNGRTALFRDQSLPKDMKVAADHVVGQLSKTRYGSERHTGPATLFKYFYQAGYEWTGAELMYSSTEITCASLRGAAKVYGGKMGGHLATQWSTTPYDAPEHAKRYRLALYISYMQGLHDINTEEGLWHMEEYYLHTHRHQSECLSHLKEHQDFYRYLSAHSRTGEFYTPVAFLSGRYDGWKLFGAKATPWGRNDFKHFDCEESWELLKLYYPTSETGSLYRHPCPTDHPVGFYSGTPMGNVDIIPIEAEGFDRHLLCAIGYNAALDSDMDKLERYVKDGGMLFIGLSQLSVTTDREDLESYRLTYLDHPFVKEIVPEIVFADDFVNGKPVHVGLHLPKNAEILRKTDSGNALLYRVRMGIGEVILLNTLEYAGNVALREPVGEMLRELSKKAFEKETVWAEGDEDVQFALYKQENSDSHIYLLSADWYRPEIPKHTTFVRVGHDRYPVEITYGKMLKAVVSGDTVAWFDEEENDVLEIKGGKIKVQGVNSGRLLIGRKGSLTELIVDFTNNSVQYIELK